MSSQIVSLAAQFADMSGAAGLAAQLSEPTLATMVAVGLAGILIGRFLLNRHAD
ncbi:hypothetical protein [Qipengyuania marisflavi]|uniref:hypothetical protein n=1 Tax=Qipengyuania marisflavi TaxID=2486356 RepID=UPI001485E6DE|nr:hypothetical protein [Qipengyuania marisflavi]